MLSLILPLILASIPLEAVVITPKGDVVGSGAFIAPDFVLTAYHVVDDFKVYQIACGPVLIPAVTVRFSKDTDLAVMKLAQECPLADIIKISKTAPERGDSVLVTGCMNGMCHTVSNGIIANIIIEPKNHNKRILSTNKIWMGSSGGPLLNDKNELIGVCNSMWGMSDIEGQNGYLFARTEYLSAFTHLESILDILSNK